MTAPQFTGSNAELEEWVDDAWTSGSPSGVLDLSQIFAWRDAAIVRHLTEAGAIHPAVHTPNRVVQWLGEHGWQAARPAYTHPYTAPWKHADGGTIHVVRSTECPDYVEWTGLVVRAAAVEAGLSVRQVLLEIAQMPDEVAW